MFFIKKGEDKSWRKTYNCSDCKLLTPESKIECFFVDPVLEIPIPRFDEDKKIIKFDNQLLELNEFFEELAILSSHFSEHNTFDLAMRYKICPQSLVDLSSIKMINLENACSKYHVLPYPGSYLEQPQIIIDCFEIIRSTTIQFENERIEKITNKGGNLKK